jgi:carboxypeptidase C (cathepsin A)
MLENVATKVATAWPGKDAYSQAPYTPWLYGKNRVGYEQTSGNLTFLVVLNASHMVPLSVPKVAQEMIGNFVHGEPFGSP